MGYAKWHFHLYNIDIAIRGDISIQRVELALKVDRKRKKHLDCLMFFASFSCAGSF